MNTKIIVASYCTEENKRLEIAEQMFNSLINTVDFSVNELHIHLNSPSSEAIAFFEGFNNIFPNKKNITITKTDENIGTSAAINLGIRNRGENQFIVKMDDDCVVHSKEWIPLMQEAMIRYPKLGVLGLKRKDLEQRPDHPTHFFKSTLRMLPHKAGERWIVIEETDDIMGTCTMLSPALLDAVGYYEQPNEYGYDDSLINFKSLIGGFKNAFLSHIEIDHIDNGENIAYREFKQRLASEGGEKYQQMLKTIRDTKKIYYNPYE